MVVVGYVIEKSEKAFSYFNRFVEVFSDVRASPFGKKKLFDSFESKIKLFDDRLVFVYSGKITAFRFIRWLLWYAIGLLGVVSIVLVGTPISTMLKELLVVLFIVGLLIQLAFYVSYTDRHFWVQHLRTMKKKRFGLKNYKKKLLSSSELINCFLWNEKPLFKKELRVEN